MKQILCLLALIAVTHCYAQTESAPPPPVYKFVEQMPVAGYDLNAYLMKNLHYPTDAQTAGIEGRVAVQFVINSEGKIGDVKIVRGIGGGCDEEAIRVISQMPDWKPGKQHGKAVSVQYTQPITFQKNKATGTMRPTVPTNH